MKIDTINIAKSMILVYTYYVKGKGDPQKDDTIKAFWEKGGVKDFKTVFIAEREDIGGYTGRTFLLYGNFKSSQKQQEFYTSYPFSMIFNYPSRNVDFNDKDIVFLAASFFNPSSQDIYTGNLCNDESRDLSQILVKEDFLNQSWVGVYGQGLNRRESFDYCVGKIEIEVGRNPADIIEKEKKSILALIGTTSYITTFTFSLREKISYKAKCVKVDNKTRLIIADSNKLFDQFVPQMEQIITQRPKFYDYGVYWLTQYHIFNDSLPFAYRRKRDGFKICVIRFVNIKNIIGCTYNSASINLNYKPQKGMKSTMRIPFYHYWGNNTREVESLILPYLAEKGIDYSVEAFSYLADRKAPETAEAILEMTKDFANKYLLTEIRQDYDVLQSWFNQCVMSSQDDNEKLLRTYQQLKDQLVKEYKDCQEFLQLYDLKGKRPVPAVRIANNMRHDVSKSVAFDIATVKIQEIGDIRLRDPVLKTERIFSWTQKGGRSAYNRTYNKEMDAFYDPATNTLLIEKNKMKGAN